jgi:hypothetical protein
VFHARLYRAGIIWLYGFDLILIETQFRGGMKYCSVYSVRFKTPATGLPDEGRLAIRGAEFVLHVDNERRTGRATITIPVDPAALSVRVGPTPLDGSQPHRGIDIPESKAVGGILRSVVRVLSFALEIPIETASLLQDRTLIPESEQDEERLRELGSLPVFAGGHVQISVRSVGFQSLDSTTLEKLLSREVGLALYSDALRLNTPTARYRELWRVLESAFGQKDADLLDLLAKYPPAVNMNFGSDELRELHVFRGRASHAESSAGLDEYHRVSERVEDLLPRLECLVHEVLLTKKTWGARSLGVERLAPLRSYVKKDGGLVLVKETHTP